MKEKTYIIMRNCCTSGNCIACMNRTPFGTPVRIEHMRVSTKAEALRVKANWSTYQAEIKEIAS